MHGPIPVRISAAIVAKTRLPFHVPYAQRCVRVGGLAVVTASAERR
jgi:hypothetical protein